VRQGRVLGIDAGERRIGVAVSDETRLLATPLVVVERRSGDRAVLDRLIDIARREQVVEVVVGLPLNEDGTAGRQARRADAFANLVERVVGLPVVRWDERLSTQAAEAVVRAQGRSVRRAQNMDAVAAAVILQDYLDALRVRTA
jgi:putative holliday junction resolvase